MAGKYAVPAEIRAMKPKGTMVKKLSGGYYVYTFTSIRDENGKRKTKMGPCVGKIDPERGFIPNEAYPDQAYSILEFGP